MLIKKANQLLADDKLKEAEFHFKALLDANPQNGEALFGLGRIALRMERFDAAVYLLQRACERLPQILEPLYALADAFNGVDSPTDALTVLKYAKSLAKHNPEPHYYLAQHYLTYGELDKAQATFSHALTLGLYPVTAYLLFELVQLGRFDKEHNYINDLHHLLTQTSNLHLKMVCYYALAKSYDQLNDIDQAENYYKLANKLQLQLSQLNTAELAPFYQKIIDTNGSDFLNQAPPRFKETITPVFIIGMPRSGSTLLEQILLNHEDFASLGEDNSISSKVVAFIEQQTQTPYPACLAKLTQSLIKKARDIYIQQLTKPTTIRPYMINKLPANYQTLGLIYVLFPDAKFIYMDREFKAIAWSVYSNYFAENEPYFCSISEFKYYYDLAQMLMAHWRTHLDKSIFTLQYEQLIDAPKDELTKLLTFLGAEYNAEMLNFYNSKKGVSTLSKAAVREPINNKAVDKWKRFVATINSLLNESQTN